MDGSGTPATSQVKVALMFAMVFVGGTTMMAGTRGKVMCCEISIKTVRISILLLLLLTLNNEFRSC